MALISLASARWAVLIFTLITWIGTVLWLWIGVRPVAFNASRAKLFMWHPILASCSVLVLFPHGFLAWRNAGGASHTRTRWLHAILMIAVFVLLNVAISLAFFSHKEQHNSNFYSLHSWVGMLAVGTMKGNIIGGLLSTFSSYVRGMKLVSKVHRMSGILAWALSFMAVLLGFAKVQESVVEKSGNAFGGLAILSGVLGLASLFVGVVVPSTALLEQETMQDHLKSKNSDEETPRCIRRDVCEIDK